jgi:hypothetical protein
VRAEGLEPSRGLPAPTTFLTLYDFRLSATGAALLVSKFAASASSSITTHLLTSNHPFSMIFGVTQEFTQNFDGLHVNTGA